MDRPDQAPHAQAQGALDAHSHAHDFLGEHHDRNARKTWIVVAITAVMMVIEIGAGAMFGSMALLADGFHMATHTGAMLIAAVAYALARRHQMDRRFSFGTGKFGDLGAFTSAIILASTALFVGYESALRLIRPEPIAFDQALPVAVLGLAVNIASAWLLRDEHHHPGDDHGEHHHSHGHDLNLRAAYIHVASDAAVSFLAILGLLAGRQLGWTWMDPLMGLVGAAVIARWSWGLLKEAGGILLDVNPAGGLDLAIIERLESDGDKVCDLHVWRLGPGSTGAIVSILACEVHTTSFYKAKLKGLATLRHVTVEVVTDAADAPHDHGDGHGHEHGHDHGHHHHHHHN